MRGISSCGGQADLRAVQRVALRDQDLRAHEVEAGDDLGDRVLDLDARVHLDEEPLVAVEIVEELDGARVVVAISRAMPRRRVAQLADARSVGSPTLGAISTTFWCRRCTEQSRSCR